MVDPPEEERSAMKGVRSGLQTQLGRLRDASPPRGVTRWDPNPEPLDLKQRSRALFGLGRLTRRQQQPQKFPQVDEPLGAEQPTLGFTWVVLPLRNFCPCSATGMGGKDLPVPFRKGHGVEGGVYPKVSPSLPRNP